MGWIIPVISMFFSIIAIVIATIITIKTGKDTSNTDIEPNEPKIEIDPSRKRFTDGYTEGNIRTIRENKNGTFFFEFYPSDEKQGFVQPIPKLKSLVVKSEFAKFFSAGEWSDHRTKIKTIPKDISRLPESIRNSFLGNFYSKESQKAFLKEVYGQTSKTLKKPTYAEKIDEKEKKEVEDKIHGKE